MTAPTKSMTISRRLLSPHLAAHRPALQSVQYFTYRWLPLVAGAGIALRF